MDSDYLVRAAGNSLLLHLDATSPSDLAYAKSLYRILLEKLASKEYDTVVQKNIFPNTLLHRQKCRLLQSCLVLWPLISTSNAASDESRELEQLLWLNVEQESLPSSRCYFEWMLILAYSSKVFQEEILLRRLQRYHGNAAMSISVLTICYHVAKINQEFKGNFWALALPYFIHNNHTVRMFITFIWQSLAFADACVGGDGDRESSVLGQYKNLTKFIYESEQCKKFVDKLQGEPMLHRFNPVCDLNVQFVFSELPLRVDMAVDECIAFGTFMNIDSIPGNIPFQSSHSYPAAIGSAGKPACERLLGKTAMDTQSTYQQKMIPLELAQAESDLQGVRRSEALKEKTANGQIIILGTYIDKVPNLAGLSRTCEVLGAAKLCVPNLAVVQSLDFQAVCMTADKWLDMEEVKPESVADYLSIKRSEGFRIIAIEQSSTSVSLVNYTFPKDIVLVLGNEREGVPAHVLHLVDECIEIPQFGMVRSLNVHVSGSLVLWEARRQKLLS